MAGLFHQLSFSDWRWNDVKGLVVTLVVLWVLFNPASWRRFAIFLLIDWVIVAITFPAHPNHIVFSWIVNGTMLASLVMVVLKDRTESTLPSRWFKAFAPWLRIELCILYFFTVFHKLNVSYFDIDWSCAAKMHREINDWVPLLPQAEWAQYLAIYGTLIIEIAIPLLLLFGRTRAGVILGMLFHGLLALHPHQGLYSFSSTMTALFTVFLPIGMAATLQPTKALTSSWNRGLYIFGSVLLLLWFSLKGFPSLVRLDRALEIKMQAGFFAYYLYFSLGLLIFVRAIRKTPNEPRVSSEGKCVAYPLLILFALLLCVNGFGPYLGLRTQTSFSMFSNLHTENGMSNHLIVPAGFQLTTWQYDLVEIIDSNDPGLKSTRDRDLLVVFLDLRRIRSKRGSDLWVTFRRNGRIEAYDAARPETFYVLPPMGFLAKRYFFFRPVEKDPWKVSCKH